MKTAIAIFDNCNTLRLKDIILDKYAESHYAQVSALTERDGDYFLEWCQEAGSGVLSDVERFYNARPLGKRMTLKELLYFLENVALHPIFISVNGRITLPFLVHIWIQEDYIIHDPISCKCGIRRMSLIDKIFHPVRNFI